MKEFPRWYYGPDGASGIFDSAEDVPEGWVTHPSLLDAEEDPDAADRAEALAILREAGIALPEDASDDEINEALDVLAASPPPKPKGRRK